MLWIIFEWRAKSENKTVIRLACGLFLSLAFLVLAITTSLAITISLLVFAPRAVPTLWGEDAIRAQLVEAGSLLGELRNAVDRDNLDAINSLSSDFKRMAYHLRVGETLPSEVVAFRRPSEVKEVQNTMDELYDLANSVSTLARRRSHPERRNRVGENEIEDRFAELEKSWDEFNRLLKAPAEETSP